MEIHDLYDKNRLLTGLTVERGAPIPEGYYHLVIHVCVFNRNGQLLIQKRKEDKKGWPGLWDVSVGGSAISGDTSRMAAQRETLEEIGVLYDFSDAIPKLTVAFHRGFDDFYMVEIDKPIEAFTPQPEEVSELKWVNREELLALLEEGQFVPYYFTEKIFDIYEMSGAIYP